MAIEKFLGLDFGEKRIGYAVSDDTNTIAFGRGIIINDSSLFKELISIIRSNHITGIVIGLPLKLSGNRSLITGKAEQFKKDLEVYLNKNNLNLGIFFADERLTSKIALDSMIESGMKKKKRQNKQNLDIISAALILQSFLDSNKTKKL